MILKTCAVLTSPTYSLSGFVKNSLVSYNVVMVCCSLQILNANHNVINDSGLPSDLFTIRDLVTLDLSHNSLSRVPEDLSKARNIIVLSLSHNSISTVPGAVSHLGHTLHISRTIY